MRCSGLENVSFIPLYKSKSGQRIVFYCAVSLWNSYNSLKLCNSSLVHVILSRNLSQIICCFVLSPWAMSNCCLVIILANIYSHLVSLIFVQNIFRIVIF